MGMVVKPGRIACCVPFCKRTASRAKFGECTEIICGKHWRMIPNKVRARRKQLARRKRKVERLALRKSIRDKKTFGVQMWSIRCYFKKAWDREWEACKGAAIEAAGGI